jgi:SnoaL-like domain
MSESETLRPAPGWARSMRHSAVQPLVSAQRAGDAVDRELIAERVARYGWAYDERDREGLGDCFTEDGVWEGQIMGLEPVGPFEGRAAIVEFLTSFWDEQSDQRRHVFTNVVLDDVGRDEATAHAYLILLGSSEASMNALTAGPYRFELVRESGDGVWRLKRLVAGFDAPY